MKRLHIIKSEIPGITRTKFKTGNKKPMFAKDSNPEKSNRAAFNTFKKVRIYKNRRILKIYRSSWNRNEFFIKHFM